MSWQEEKYREVHERVRDYYCLLAKDDPGATLQLLEQELDDLYLRYGNNWTGRGIVGDTVMTASIDAMELARAECLALIQQSGGASCHETGQK